ncbi:MAG: ATP-dependent DNA helicase RecG [Chloroflexi bacterium]|nr:ATP-dependent DNA helicase RecG [Chloroflexota bacterium]MBT4515304.1 ATP-dependent DNA helicase RecG [Chloroflexota bacterium]MBT6681716.1 ATP-dependent DNA helicase RecG [Chloroflexota bacterium]
MPPRPEPRSRPPRRSARESLSRILDLEASRGFKDAAVAGGLDLFLDANREELSSLELPDSYAALTVKKREEWARATRAGVEANATQSIPETQVKSSARSPVAKPKKKAASTRKKPVPKPKKPTAPLTLETALEDLPFITSAQQPRFKRLGITDLRSLVRMYPNRHLDYSNISSVIDLVYGEEMSVVVTVTSSTTANIGRRGAAKVTARDETGFVGITWFGQPYLAQQLRPGTRLVVSGKVEAYRDQAQFQNPEYEVIQGDNLTHAGNLLPIYPSTEGMYQRTLRTAARNALDAGLPLLGEYIGSDVLERNVLPGLLNALQTMHHPDTMADWHAARRRLAFDELFINQLGVQRRKREWRERAGGLSIEPDHDLLRNFLKTLEFELTSDQDDALNTVLSDISSEVPMGRLLQGEVGSGKTIIAVTALLAAVSCGHQGALLAPTEVLAEQHYLSLQTLFDARPLGGEQASMLDPEDEESSGPKHGGDPVVEAHVPGIDSPVRIALLIGSHTARVKRELQAQIASGEIDIIVGTHAVIQESVQFEALGLAVVDEQHRFGVEQRAVLGDQRPRPHLLGMSATPIPRTLALTVYGDLDLTTLRQLPGGRKPITTSWARTANQRAEAHELVLKEVAAGRQAFVVCPLINESEEIRTRSAIEEFEFLSNGPFKSLRVGLLHGRLPLTEKQQVMDLFREREIDVLVATPVIEVGIDIPNATVMLIEGAERFGLSQLHQLRGRIGRGGYASHCILSSDEPSADARERLGIIERTSDGFDLAEEDLRLRGPGDYIGTRQSGFADLLVATLTDADLLATARAEAIDMIADDPGLTDPGHEALGRELDRILRDRVAEFS